MKKTLTNY